MAQLQTPRLIPLARNTRWKNPTVHTIIVDLHTESTRDNPSGRERHVWAPGETREVPAEFDNAIRRVRDGKVVSGLAPQLVVDGERPVPLDPAIDSEAAERKQSRDELRDAQALEKAAKAQLADAAARVAANASEKAEAKAEPKAEQLPTKAQQQGQERAGK